MGEYGNRQVGKKWIRPDIKPLRRLCCGQALREQHEAAGWVDMVEKRG